MNYREHAPSAPLRSVIQCIWTLEGHASELDTDLHPVLPDGRPELVVHFGDAFERLAPNGLFERQPSILFAGQLTTRLVLRPTGRIAVVGVRLHPHGAATLFREPQHELAGLTIGIHDLSTRLFRSLTEAHGAGQTLERAAKDIQDRIAACADVSRIDPYVGRAVDDIYRHGGLVPVGDLAARLGVTRRHLERRFKSHVGMSPKRLARIARFQHALQVLERAAGRTTGAETAAVCGYADQAHFVREFRELCGCPPGAHLLQRAQLTRFFIG